MTKGRPGGGSERGAALIAVGLAILILAAVSVYVIDFGILWLGRRQAQNAADAGALAGAIARAYDEFADPPSAGGPVERAARDTAGRNLVWGEAPGDPTNVDIGYDCPPGVTPSEGCVRVDVFRDVEHGNPLPAWFGPLVGITQQGVRATATGQARNANGVRCLKPWAIADAWIDNYDVDGDIDTEFTSDDKFQKYSDPEGEDPLPNPDVYRPPWDLSPSGYGLGDIGRRISLRYRGADVPFSASSFLTLALPGSVGYGSDITSCYQGLIAFGDPGNPTYLPLGPAGGGATTYNPVLEVIGRDASATWNPATNSWQGGCCAGADLSCCVNGVSPRAVAVAVFDVDEYTDLLGASATVKVTNVIGFFLVPPVDASDEIEGYVMSYPGLLTSGPTPWNSNNAFLKAITLVR